MPPAKKKKKVSKQMAIRTQNQHKYIYRNWETIISVYKLGKDINAL